jgi:hypothetical protein
MTDFEEPEDFDLCGVKYKATRTQANEIMAIVIETKEWRDYARTTDRLRYGDFSATDPEAVKMVAEHVENFRAAFREVKRLIDRY